MSPGARVEPLLVSLLRGDLDAARHAEEDIERVLAAADEEGVTALIADALATSRAPAFLRARFADRARAQAIVDIVREEELRRLLGAFHAEGIDVLLMKGAQLAYSCYARPDLRPRLDTDLLTRADDRHRAQSVLTSSGYSSTDAQQDGDLLMYQTTFVKTAGHVRHTVDLHWRALNPQVFAHVFETESLFANALPLPRLSAAARGLSRVDALLLALVHRVAHHDRRRPLIWTCDIHLLAAAFTESDWRILVPRILAGDVGAVAHHGLEDARKNFGTALPSWVMKEIAGRGRTTASYIEPGRHAGRVLKDVRAVAGWSNRWRLLAQYAFPRADYMRRAYAPGSRMPLAWLYIVRIVRGGSRWMRKSA